MCDLEGAMTKCKDRSQDDIEITTDILISVLKEDRSRNICAASPDEFMDRAKYSKPSYFEEIPLRFRRDRGQF